MLNLKEIKKDYQTSSETVHALKGVSIAFRRSEFVSILGPSALIILHNMFQFKHSYLPSLLNFQSGQMYYTSVRSASLKTASRRLNSRASSSPMREMIRPVRRSVSFIRH